MRITPLDVRKQEFRKGMRGLDPEEVYAFLSTVADEYESVLNDNKALRERLLELDDKVQEYRSMEKTLRDTLLTAERVNVEAKDNARREANIIIKEAQIEAEKALRDIKTEAMKLRHQVQQLRSQRDAYLARMKVVAESHLSTVISSAADFKREDDAVGEFNDSEEHLADEPVDRDVAESQRPGGLFTPEPRPMMAEPLPTPIPATPQPPVVDVAPVSPAEAAPISTPPADRHPEPAPVSAPVERHVEPAPAPVSTPVERSPEPSSALPPRAPEPHGPVGLPGGGVDPISVIIDRMKKGQQEILSAGAGSFGVKDGLAPQVQPSPPSSESLSATALAEAPATDASLIDDTDVTSEFSLDEIRRELAAEDKGER